MDGGAGGMAGVEPGWARTLRGGHLPGLVVCPEPRTVPDLRGDAMWDWLADAYRSRIVDNGREPLFLLHVG
ncbi:hypothetical protein ABZ721_11970, partial [Streptomyces sp. NPDC006733]|uniref:hypothetical protein n=1 Tax=Streptomyces sp. NPDC006733 TaxID=3155460 RepID=UPI0033F5AA29